MVNKTVIVILVFLLLLFLFIASVFLKNKDPSEPVSTPTAEPVVTSVHEATKPAVTSEPEAAKPVSTSTPDSAEPSANAQEVLVVFISDKTDDFSDLTVESTDGKGFAPVSSDDTGQPIYGAYFLPVGEYRFSLSSVNATAVSLVIPDSVDSTVVPIEAPAEPFLVNEFSGVSINPVYEGIISEDAIEPITQSIDERVEALRSFYCSVKNKK